jgi:glyoxylase-like metal-dependent hydrolase (beta-lactamase superfamily II)
MTQPIQIPLPIPYAVGPVNSYLFLDPVPTLVDCGLKTDACWHALLDGLAQHGLTVSDIQRLVITHAHVDHIGLAGKIAAHSQAEICVSTLVEPWALHINEKWPSRMKFMVQTLAPFGFTAADLALLEQGMATTTTMWDPIPAERLVTFDLADTLDLGGLPWQVIYTPGHCNNQTCFYQEATGQFLAADMLLAVTPTPVIEEPIDGGDERVPGLPQFLDSLALVEELAIDIVYPGHGTPFTDHRALIERQSTRIAERTEQCYDLIATEDQTFRTLLQTLYGGRPTAELFPAIGMLLGYIDLLEVGGLIKGYRQDEVLHYRVTV